MADPFELTDELAGGAAAPAYLDALNPSQRAAVEATEGPVLVLAGAGTGKTRVLTTRMAHILRLGRARPWQVLAVTFTNKAAREMRERVAGLLGCPLEGWWLGTFHALAARMLRAHAEVVGLQPNFTILDTDDQLRLIKQLLEARRVDVKRTPPRMLHTVIERWKDRGLTPDRVTAEEGAGEYDGLPLALYADYADRLKTLNAADFGDLLLHCLTLFRDAPQVLARYQTQFRYLLVDEYQDTNIAQYLWLRALAQGHHSICCVGDDDQSIYSWRGAEIGNILRFEQDFPGAQVIRLEFNYRSTPHILAAASRLIAHNRSRLGKTLWTHHSEGERVVVRAAWDGEDEARMVCDDMERWHRQGHALREMAVLVRAGFQTREFEERLIIVGLPYRIVGGLRFYERQEIRDAVAYLRIVVQPDDDLAFERIVNVPKRGLGATSLRSVHMLARAEGLSLHTAARRLTESEELKAAARRSLGRLLDDFARWRSLLGVLAPADLARQVLDESGYTDMWQQNRNPDAAGRLENLKELVAAIADFESLGGFLEHVSLVMDKDEAADGDRVTLMTLHAAKGLEFDTVFLPGWEEGLFPHQRALDEGGEAALEEERRLAYVGLTRARRRAVISFAGSRHVFGYWQNARPSRFIDELPTENIEARGPRGVISGVGGHRLHTATLDADTTAPRLAARTIATARPPLLEGVAYTSMSRPASRHAFAVGQQVMHKVFGRGRVLAVDGDKLDIAFETGGTRKVVNSFVETA